MKTNGMDTIEQRAAEYAQSLCKDGDCALCDAGCCLRPLAKAAFVAGARSEHDALTRWHDPKEVLPEENTCVLIKTVTLTGDNAIYMGYWAGDCYITDTGYVFGNSFEDQIDGVMMLDVKAIGWRAIID